MGGFLIEAVTNLANVTPSILPALRDSLSERLFKTSPQRQLSSESNLMKDDIKEILEKASDELPKEEFELTLQDSIEKYYEHQYDLLKQVYKEEFNRSRIYFTITIIALVVGVVGMLSGILLLFFHNSLQYLISISAVIPVVLSSLTFFEKRREDDRLNKINKELNLSARSLSAMKYIDQISDPDRRSEALAEVIKEIVQKTESLSKKAPASVN